MALIDTDIKKQDAFELNSLDGLSRALKMAQAEELAAQCTYQRLVESLKKSTPKGAGDLKIYRELNQRLEEIATDEMNHAGSLQYCIGLVESCYKKAFKEGFDGE